MNDTIEEDIHTPGVPSVEDVIVSSFVTNYQTIH